MEGTLLKQAKSTLGLEKDGRQEAKTKLEKERNELLKVTKAPGAE